MSTINFGATHLSTSPSVAALSRFEKWLPTLLSVIAGMVDLRPDKPGTDPGYSRFHPRRRCHLATRQSIGQTRSRFAPPASLGSISVARLRFDF
jgi:hypothetical protein